MYKILHIDSSGFFRKNLGFEFSAKGFYYVGAESFEEALEIIEKEKDIEIILTAVEFSSGNIEDFISTVNIQKNKQIPIFVISGTQNTAKRLDIYEIGIVDYILKSTPIPDIVEKVNDFCKNRDLLEKLKKVKIAVLDDSKFDRLKMSDIFSASEIKNVDFFEKAEDLDNSNKDYEVYIIDMVLADSSGEEVVVNIRKKDKYVPILAVSAIENSKTISQVLLKGATDYIVKPYNKNVFLARIEIALRNYKIIKELLGKIANEQL